MRKRHRVVLWYVASEVGAILMFTAGLLILMTLLNIGY